ncbi:MAG: DUF1189 family protein [Candidatus Eremiobacteraeota bacterium]|nr:DUF1189 family protein [Candidatus Eremiobacteraeota bacterium]
MKEHGFFGKLGIALFKPSNYRQLVHMSTGRVIGYYLLFILIFSIIATPRIAFNVKRNISSAFDQIKDKIPGIVIESGEISSEVPQPYEIANSDDFRNILGVFGIKREIPGDFRIILDTTGEITTLESGLLIEKDALVFFSKGLQKTPGNETGARIPLADFIRHDTGRIEIDNTFADKAFKAMYWPITISIFVIIFIGYFIIGIIWLFIASIPSAIFNSTQKANISYGQLLTLGIFALVPVLAIKLLWILLGIKFAFSFRVISLLMIIVYFVYLWIAISKIGANGGLKVTTTSAPTVSAAAATAVPPLTPETREEEKSPETNPPPTSTGEES